MKKLFALIFATVMMAAATCLAAAKPILVLGAMGIETDLLMQKLEKPKFFKVAEHTCASGKINGQPVVVMRSHMGMVNASSAATIGIMKFNPSMVISTGTAGATHADVKLNDIVVCERLCNTNVYSSEPVPAGGGFSINNWTFETMEFFKNGAWQNANRYIHSDKKLVKSALEVSYKHGALIKGTTVSSDAWMRECDWVTKLQKQFGTDCEEMESFAIATVASKFNVPFVAIRIVSNSEFTNAGTTKGLGGDDEDFYTIAAGYEQEFVYDYLKALTTKAK